MSLIELDWVEARAASPELPAWAQPLVELLSDGVAIDEAVIEANVPEVAARELIDLAPTEEIKEIIREIQGG
jgi:hypothetical protein